MQITNVFMLDCDCSLGMCLIMIRICRIEIKWAGLYWDRQRGEKKTKTERCSPFSKHHPSVFDNFMCVMKVQCVTIYKVPARRGGLITGSRCRLTRPLTECGVKEGAREGKIWSRLSFTEHSDDTEWFIRWDHNFPGKQIQELMMNLIWILTVPQTLRNLIFFIITYCKKVKFTCLPIFSYKCDFLMW